MRRPALPRLTGAAPAQGFDITPDLRRMCSGLTLQQIYKLTEHHHDDWIAGSQTTDTLVLLQTLKRVVDSTVRFTPTMQTDPAVLKEPHVLARSHLPREQT